MKGEASLDPVKKDVVGTKEINVMLAEKDKVRLVDEEKKRRYIRRESLWELRRGPLR